jgi:TonB family protein
VSKFSASLAILAGLALVVPLAAIQSQEPVEPISDAEFLRIERAGPAGSAELEQLVDAYVANGREAEAAEALARFMLGEYGTADEHGCDFCRAVLATEGARRRHAHFAVMVDALDRIEQRAEAQGSGDLLLQAVLDNAAGSTNARGMSRSTYYVMRAVQIGIDDASALEIVGYLYEQGSIDEAKDLATRLFDNEASPHYQSDAARQWVVFLESEIMRRASLTRMIFDSLGVNDEILDEEYVPIAKIPPVYPKEAADAGVEGTVVVEFTVSTKGRPEGVTVVSSTNTVFDSSAVAAAREFRYAPRVVAGTPVAVPGVRNKIAFVLER